MKKVLLSAFVVAGLLATSCKKDRTCTCKYSDGTLVAPAVTIKDTKKKAKDACNALQSTYSIIDPTTCTLD
jgi:hypothetical protein